MDLVKGQKTKLRALTPEDRLTVTLALAAPEQTEVDLSCFGLDGAGKLSDDRYFVFYNQKASPCGHVAIRESGDGRVVFDIDLAGIPEGIRRLVFVATLDGPGAMRQAGPGRFEIGARGASPAAVFAFQGSQFEGEKALMIAELYIKGPAPDREWRLAAVGQGFAGGLAALLKHFGGEVLEEEKPSPPPPKVNLGKLTLEKRGDSQRLSLDKGDSAPPMHINLNWQHPKAKGLGGLLGGNRSADLDLGCMFELKDGMKGVIQPLGNRFGSKSQPPYIHLDQDDRSGASAGGENMYIFRPALLKRCVVFALVYEGSRNFTEVEGRVVIKDGRGTEITVFMDAPDARRTFCAVCALEAAGSELQIRKEERYFSDHEDCDRHYGFGFRWVAGRK